jgi:hypothetical protein
LRNLHQIQALKETLPHWMAKAGLWKTGREVHRAGCGGSRLAN